MRKLLSIYRNGNEELRFYQCPRKVSAIITSLDGKRFINSYDSIRKDVETFIKLEGEKQIINFLGFKNYYKVPFERKNGKIVLYPVNKQKRVIWSNDDYDEWAEAMADEITDEEITPEYYGFCRENDLDDERANLNVEVDGYIVAYANLGLWNGRVRGAKLIGTNVSQILYTNDDYATWFCDPHNVKAETIHHDGRNYVLYRVAETKEKAELLVNRIAYGGMSEENFRRATKSLRPYVANVFGW
jgi:hypothetical protein